MSIFANECKVKKIDRIENEVSLPEPPGIITLRMCNMYYKYFVFMPHALNVKTDIQETHRGMHLLKGQDRA